jgi:hypothetical protein
MNKNREKQKKRNNLSQEFVRICPEGKAPGKQIIENDKK